MYWIERSTSRYSGYSCNSVDGLDSTERNKSTSDHSGYEKAMERMLDPPMVQMLEKATDRQPN